MIILASQSPRRKDLMSLEITRDFKIVVSNSEETYPNELKDPKDIVKVIAQNKGKVVHTMYPNDIVISADTIVVLDNEIIGKPKDKDDAFKMLRKLSNRTHFVYTSYSIFKNDILVSNVVKSEVLFHELTDELIKNYIATGSPMDKAGAYGLQDNKTYPTVKKVIGSVNNVIGFPTDEIKADLKKYFGFEGEI